jgi:hypothetical protein
MHSPDGSPKVLSKKMTPSHAVLAAESGVDGLPYCRGSTLSIRKNRVTLIVLIYFLRKTYIKASGAPRKHHPSIHQTTAGPAATKGKALTALAHIHHSGSSSQPKRHNRLESGGRAVQTIATTRRDCVE